jgi:outer membrane protein TolC
MRHAVLKPLALGTLALLLGGCATFSPDGGMGDVSALTKERVGQPVKRGAGSDAAVDELLGQPLDADSAVKIALMNNRGLQASFAELGVSEADFVQAGRLRNPGFSFSRLRGGDNLEIDRSVMFDLAGLLTLPARSGIEKRRFEQAKLNAAADAVRLAATTRRSYFTAVAAQQHVQFMRQVKKSAEAAAELARRMQAVGNFSQLDAEREQAFYAETIVQLARATQDAVAARERLTQAMGLWGPRIEFKLPDRLPELPKSLPEVRDIEGQAMQQRLDVQIAKRDTEATAHALGLTRATRFVNVLDAGYLNKSTNGAPRENGYEVSLEIPLFDWGAARTGKAEALYMAAVNRTADTAVRARSEVRVAYSAYRTAFDLAHHYRDEIVPLRQKISDEMLLRYNGMLVSVFELLADARDQAASVNAAIEAQRDYWIAETDLQYAINGGAADAMNAGR